MDKFIVEYDQSLRGEVKPGKYEVLIVHTEVKTFPRSGKGIELGLLIRSDIEQDEQGEIQPDSLHFTSKAVYKPRMVAKALGIPVGSEYSLSQFAKTILFRPVRIAVVERDDENGFARSRVSYYEKGAEIAPEVLKGYLKDLGLSIEEDTFENRLTTNPSNLRGSELTTRHKTKLDELNGYTHEELEWISEKKGA